MAMVFWDLEGILMVERLSLFDKLKDPLHISRFPNNDDLQSGVYESVHTIPSCCFHQEVTRKMAMVH
jgi:hypothetical protein